jgi:mono/diheme cytochrome c family protein
MHGKSGCNVQETSGLEGTVIKRDCKNKLGLGAGAIGLILFLGLPARAQETGEALFKAKCAMCHGPDASGKTVMGEKLKVPDLRSETVQKKSDAELRSVIGKGKDKMPAYESKLSKEQIGQLVAYIRGLAKH